ncbi:hypothetical protein FQB35_14380 [Crassaminicella thermophila]|uniref:Uncharacterized protein n=1 Tax=Crassaminicella thermophila TaxID=2599308 RepID=A0A5C0SFU4_CRATE|nr:hypothetical protein [Crassaminicella thermophila]QEK13363.1 hypothetical protein FQB35_14380 [Crassaminicella thermophila]
MYPYPYYDYMGYCESEAEKMYPEVCKDLNPYIEKICAREDHIYNSKMYPFPKKETVEEMVDEIYEMYIKDNMYRSPDGGYGHRGLFKSLIWILLLGKLLGRRRRRRPGYGYPGYGYPGYGYPGGDYPGYGY